MTLHHPDFVLIGAMKAGTTTLFRRLGDIPGVTLPEIKEPHYFSHRWDMGEEWYRSVFDGCAGITGEASASYSDAATAEIVAGRMARSIPDVRLLYALRDPVARIRSHYMHEVLRAREDRPFEVAIGDPDSPYVSSSLYGAVVQAYRQHVAPDRLMIFDISELDDNPTLWGEILAHIGAEPAPMSNQTHNVSADKAQFTPTMLWLWEKGVSVPDRAPRWMRRLAKRILTRNPASSRLLDTADRDLTDEVVHRLDEDRRILADQGVAIGSWQPLP